MPPEKLGTASSTSLGESCPSDCAIGLTTVIRFDRWYKVACEATVGQRDCVTIFGGDYDTPDGTC